jgi:hypothetical protein
MKTCTQPKLKTNSFAFTLVLIAALAALSTSLMADESAPTAPVVAGQPISAPSSDTRYGPFGVLDHRSAYGMGAFPEPFIIDDSDLEVNEVRLDWTFTQAHDSKDHTILMEVEKGFGPATLEIEAPYEVENTSHPSHTANGFDNIDLGARVPFYQYVSPNKFIDSTFGVGIEVGIPTQSTFSKDTEIVPKIFNDLRIAERFTLQSIAGYSTLHGPGDDGNNAETFEYGFVLGYTINHAELPIPNVLQVIPVFELSGETGLNHGQGSQNSLTGNAALRFNTKPIGSVQPRLGVGYIFPIDNHAREDMQWGFITSLVFEY